jgi:hypothetical protein
MRRHLLRGCLDVFLPHGAAAAAIPSISADYQLARRIFGRTGPLASPMQSMEDGAGACSSGSAARQKSGRQAFIQRSRERFSAPVPAF